jgi:cystathionine beta-lyase/cystathionine gamma-synthase
MSLSKTIPDGLVGASLDDYANDFADLAAHAESCAVRVQAFRCALSDDAANYSGGAFKHLWEQSGSLITSIDGVAAALRARLERLETWTRDDLDELRRHKREVAELLRTLYRQMGFVLGAGDWQSPSLQHSLHSQVGKQRSGIGGILNDYTRGGYADATEYEHAFRSEYVDNAWRFPPEVFVTSSGMAAFATVLFHLQSIGVNGAVIAGASSYFENQWLLRRTFHADLHLVDEADTEQIIHDVWRLRPMAVFLDTLCNAPTLAMPDLSALLPRLARALPKGAAIVLDNSGLSTSCQPLNWLPRLTGGVRLYVIESLNKYHQFGFDRVTGGVVWTSGGIRRTALSDVRKHLGTIMPDTSALSLPSANRERLMKRLRRIGRNVSLLAERLDRHLVAHRSAFASHVVYPGLPSHPCHAWARKGAFCGGSLVIAPRAAFGHTALARLFIRRAIENARRDGIDLIAGTSFGLDVTRLYLTARFATEISTPFLRLSAGTESRGEIEAIAAILIRTLGN